jgi:hypothetical protein
MAYSPAAMLFFTVFLRGLSKDLTVHERPLPNSQRTDTVRICPNVLVSL